MIDQSCSRAPIRIAFYSHDTFGLGHLSRCLKIAGAMSRGLPRTRGLLLTGSPQASAFRPPAGFGMLRLPAVTKCADGSYRARRADTDLEAVVRERSRRILDAVATFEPDLLVVDNVPAGLHDEVLPALRQRARGGARCVLTLRDVLDDRQRVRSEWQRPGAREALDRYDEMWVFGDRRAARQIVQDAELESKASSVRACGALGLSETRAMAQQALTPYGTTFDGANPGLSRSASRRIAPSKRRPRILVTGGGGGDADRLVRVYIDALRRFAPAVSSRIVLGPEFDPGAFSDITSHNGFEASFTRFVPSLAAELAAADVVVSMAGYNTVCELRGAGCRSVLVPRVQPRREQWLRASRLAGAAHCRVLHPEAASPAALWSVVQELIEAPPPAPERLPGGANAVARAAWLMGTAYQLPTETKTVH